MRAARLWPFVVAMALVVVASNVLVQFPVRGQFGALDLADLLTWGAFTYPAAFLVTDLANRRYGPRSARRVVFAGFGLSIVASALVPLALESAGLLVNPLVAERLMRIALASGAAFLVGQLLDVTVFNRLRAASWWRAPVFASLAGSVLDTAVFFALAFAPAFMFLGASDAFALETSPLVGLFALEPPRWFSWALGDLAVKVVIAVLALVPYRLIAAGWRQPAVA